MEEVIDKDENQQVLKVLELLKQASHDLHSNLSHNPTESNSAAIKALLELQTESDTILSDPNLSQLSHHLSYLKTLVDSLHQTRGHSLRSFLRRRVSTHQIARVAESIESELQAWIDREFMDSLVKAIDNVSGPEPRNSEDDAELTQLLTQFHHRVSQGFDRELQDLVLKSRVFSELEAILVDPTRPVGLREEAALAGEALIRFNKNVFVGQVLMGPTVTALVALATPCSLRVMCGLIKSIKSPIVDEIEGQGEIPNIIAFLNHEDVEMRVIGLDCVLEIGYFGRKEAVEAMINEEVVEKLVELQRSELGGDLIDVGKYDDADEKSGRTESRDEYLERHPFASCVARFAVQLEVGEGLRQREKRALKQVVLSRVREASVSHAEAATIQAEVLWGSFS